MRPQLAGQIVRQAKEVPELHQSLLGQRKAAMSREILHDEMKWCRENKGTSGNGLIWEDGFIDGLKHAKVVQGLAAAKEAGFSQAFTPSGSDCPQEAGGVAKMDTISSHHASSCCFESSGECCCDLEKRFSSSDAEVANQKFSYTIGWNEALRFAKAKCEEEAKIYKSWGLLAEDLVSRICAARIADGMMK